ncbi:hypothetical protein ScPMuIL_018126 [Solemya velum]
MKPNSLLQTLKAVVRELQNSLDWRICWLTTIAASTPANAVSLAARWKERYGPLMFFTVANRTVVGLNTVDVAHEALRKMEFGNRPYVASLQLLSGGGNNIGQSQIGPRWRLHRKLAIRGIGCFLQGDSMDTKIRQAFKITSECLESMKGPFNPKSIADLTIYNMLRPFLVNKSYRLEEAGFQKMIGYNDDLISDFGAFMIEDIIPPLRHIYPSRKYRRTAERIKYIQDELGWKELREHKAKFDPDNITDYMDVLIEEQKKTEAEGGPEDISLISDKYIVMNVVDLFTAGTDTTRSTLNWMIKFLVVYPEVQSKARDEIDNTIGRDRLPMVSDRNALPYCEAVMLETMRMRPPLPFSLVHTTRCDTELRGYQIPKDSVVGLNLYTIHHDPDQWDEPEVYRPERFIKDGVLDQKPRSWLTFGTGVRACLGENMAKTELILILACLLQQFYFRLPDGVTELDMDPAGCAFVHITRPYKIIAEKRE